MDNFKEETRSYLMLVSGDTGSRYYPRHHPPHSPLDAVYTTPFDTRDLTEVFQQQGSLPDRRYSAAAAAVPGKILIAGGYCHTSESVTKTVHSLNTETLTWSREPDMTMNREMFTMTIVRYKSSMGLLIAGGRDEKGKTLATCEILNDGTWTAVTSLPEPLLWHAACASVEANKVYLTGGIPKRQRTLCWDPDKNSWEEKKQMKKKRYNHCMCCLHDAIYVFGGYNSVGVERYDIQADQWTILMDMPMPKYRATCVTVNDWVIILGGSDDKILLFDTGRKSWKESKHRLPWKELIYPLCCVITPQ